MDHYEAGNYQKALEKFALLLVHEPLNPDNWKGVAASQQMLGAYVEATQGWAWAALLSQNDPAPHFHAAECLVKQGKFEEATVALKEARTLDENRELSSLINTLEEVIEYASS